MHLVTRAPATICSLAAIFALPLGSAPLHAAAKSGAKVPQSVTISSKPSTTIKSWAATPVFSTLPNPETSRFESRGFSSGRGSDLVIITEAAIETKDDATLVRLALSRRAVPKIFTLSAPYRIVVDISNSVFHLPRGLGKSGAGLISAFRYGLLTPLKSRLVLDATGPVSIKAVRLIDRGNDRSEIVLELLAVSAAEFVPQGREPKLSPQATLRKGQYAHTRKNQQAHSSSSKKSSLHERDRKPVIVIDPGHGGPDPGAIGRRNTYEKMVALAVGKRLWRKLAAAKRYEVVMTRSRDIFVSLQDRVQLSSRVAADLFISLHADATEQAAAEIRGATIYTLSPRASNLEARRFAAKENASDILAGFPISSTIAANKVESILIDLMKRETQSFSLRMSERLVGALRGNVVLARDPRRAAAFKVLKQTRTPSVLVEMGYISNPRDEQQMRDPDWQDKTAAAIALAVARFFSDKRSVPR